MSGITLNPEQSAQLQAEIQRELERREWAEPEDNVMAEYITVLLANGSARERVQTEMDDLVGSDFDPAFLDWLFSAAKSITSAPSPSPIPTSAAVPTASTSQSPVNAPRGSGGSGSRLLNTALAPLSSQPEKRKAADTADGNQNKKRLSDVGVNAPSGPRGMGSEGRSLADRIGGGNVRGRGVPIRGMAGGRGGNMNMGGHMGFRPNFQQQNQQQPGFNQPGFGQPFMPQGQQEMVAQMMMMQASMAQMNNMVASMMQQQLQFQQQQQQQQQVSATSARPPRPPSVKVPHGTKLGAHSVSGIPPKSAGTPGPIPDKPTSTALCRFSVGCSNSRCSFSHPSPVADEQTGMVLSEEPCENGKECKDAECIKSHVSPAAILGESAGPSRLLCKYQNCTNPSCPFRHEDENGNPIPPPALTASKAPKPKIAPVPVPSASSDNEDDGGDGDVEVVMSHKGLMDGALDDTKKEVSCRYGERCTRPDCKFTHPPGRPTPKFSKKFGSSSGTFNKSITSTNGGGIGGGMHLSKKFGSGGAAASEKKLDPTAGEFKPSEKELEVTY
uniref:C3H1-type domain-containing protein n=1 Tax=Kwoniella bestiolae CBS 10118 TaxID=1296100 RepID=A0A1B9G2W7_9TREE|nr:hypothetical protein I302_05183 [Kwoniella bestiolae CBS 10118]OCF25364.1 hypothetical protein I302_05183 [Kwoniella bestiolae CBS 10118]